MTTALKIIQEAFDEAGIRADEEPLTAPMLAGGLRALNNLIKQKSAIGILKGISPTYDSSVDLNEDTIVTPYLIYNVAMMIVSRYELPSSVELATMANNSYNDLIASSWNLDTEFPDTLPTGSGNCDEWFDDDFFDQNSKDNF